MIRMKGLAALADGGNGKQQAALKYLSMRCLQGLAW